MNGPRRRDPNAMPDATRRRLLSGAAGAAALALAPGFLLLTAPEARAEAAGAAASAKVRWGILIDTGKLNAAACDAIVAACNLEHGLEPASRPDATAQWIRAVDVRDPRTGAGKTVLVMCQHCEFPPCADVCPTGASFRRADGVVLVDKHICIGCRYCMLACPYKARSFAYEEITGQKPYSPRGKGTVQACTMCVHRIDEGGRPACVEAAAMVAPGAMTFGDLKDPESEISKKVSAIAVRRIRADLRVEPGVLYAGL